MQNWIMDYKEMRSVIDKLREEGWEGIKLSTILDRGEFPAMTIEWPQDIKGPDLLSTIQSDLQELGYDILAPIRRINRKAGSRAMKFSLQRR